MRFGAVRAIDAYVGENARVTYEFLFDTCRITNAVIRASTSLAAAALSYKIALNARTGNVSLRRQL